MSRKGILLGVALGAFLIGCDEINVTDADVTVGGGALTFLPASLTLTTKRPVEFAWGGGPHNVTWEDGAPGSGDKASGTYTRVFTAAAGGDYRYRCTIHSTSFTSGMIGSVTVPAP